MRAWRCALLALVTVAGCGLPEPERDIEYARLFGGEGVATWRLAVPEDTFRGLLLCPGDDRPADLEVGGLHYLDVGLRFTGDTNRTKIGMRIRANAFNPSLRLFGAKRVVLGNAAGDPSLVRELLALQLLREAGVPAPRAAPVWLDWGGAGGVYTLVEQVDRKFLDDRFGENDGALFGVERGGNLVYRGDDPAAYDWEFTYPAGGDGLVDPTPLIDLMRALALTSLEERRAALERRLDVEGFLRWLAANALLLNLDSYAGTGGEYFLYHGADGRFRFIPGRQNRAFANFYKRTPLADEGDAYCAAASVAWCRAQVGPRCHSVDFCVSRMSQTCAEDYPRFCAETADDVEACMEKEPAACGFTPDELLVLDPDAPACSIARPLIQAVLTVPAFRARYHALMAELLDGPLAEERVLDNLWGHHDRVAEYAARDAWKDGTTGAEFERSFVEDTWLDPEEQAEPERYPERRVLGLEPFVRARNAYLRNKIQGATP